MSRAALLLLGLVAACGALPPPPDTARITGAVLDPDVPAIYQAEWAFADPARTAGRPYLAARAAAYVDYLGGELSTSPRWAFMSPVTKDQMLAAREEVRQAIGVAPGTRSQAVVDSLLSASEAMVRGDQDAALAALSGPGFTLGPQQTMVVLANLPYLPIANRATSRASSQSLEPNGRPCFQCG